jgi:crotonobetainyl-CoA:carnitine CoA-transferase CaiB-like acyl-CoA transferase
MLDGRARTSPLPAPRIGEHTRAALAAFGFADQEIEALLAAGAACQHGQAGQPAGAAAA